MNIIRAKMKSTQAGLLSSSCAEDFSTERLCQSVALTYSFSARLIIPGEGKTCARTRLCKLTSYICGFCSCRTRRPWWVCETEWTMNKTNGSLEYPEKRSLTSHVNMMRRKHEAKWNVPGQKLASKASGINHLTCTATCTLQLTSSSTLHLIYMEGIK